MVTKNKKKNPRTSSKISLTRKKIQKGTPFLWIGGALLVAIVLLGLMGKVPFIGLGSKKGKSFSVQGGETRPVLDPSLFTGMARAAYTAAKEYPGVMDQVFCYCKCDKPPFNHKSLLSCFTENHGKR